MSTWKFRRIEYSATRTQTSARVVCDSDDPSAVGRGILGHLDMLGRHGWQVIGDKGMIVTLKRHREATQQWEHRWIWYESPDAAALTPISRITFSDLPPCIAGENLLDRLEKLSREQWEVIFENFYHDPTQRFCIVRRTVSQSTEWDITPDDWDGPPL